MAGNKDIQVTGSQSAAKAAFLQNAHESALQGDVAGSQYWYALAVQAAQSGQHMYHDA